ncbi:hypothetical protein K227x_15340 [Rubripirellula lacrimiformis]|uniref:AlgX/AlgJ SGNH hydrolase-like domain-containing protein n=1 Tax=Rubripirellula lacrimiformis TaxID=1930273 RepID=A0A517N7P2_9BACT|nr:hypothetical protein [Rubripirellula lacrimiformis]QDT03152.1 hypothetical protein K227x_15340 [Rubripirellula lacrimiformis]
MLARIHFFGLVLCLTPSIVCLAVAIGADVTRGGDFIAQWGTGQSVIAAIGILAGILGIALHRKAVKDEQARLRRYSRTILFAFVPPMIAVGLPLLAAEWIASRFPADRPLPSVYQQPDPTLGFALTPNRQYRIVSEAKDFDIDVTIDAYGFRTADADPTDRSLGDYDVIILGDSHAFGLGVASNETLASQLSMKLAGEGLPANVANAGVPGFGLGQFLLRMRSMKTATPGTVFVIWINPLNDLVNLSMAVDYHFPKPSAVVSQSELQFQPIGSITNDTGFLFSETFDSLNDTFGLRPKPRWRRSELLSRLAQASPDPLVIEDGVIQLVDSTSPAQYLIDDEQRIQEQPLVYASRYWPEMPAFEPHRAKLKELTDAVLRGAARIAQERDWKLIAIVAPEGHQHQSYAKNFMRQVEAAADLGPMEPGWSHNMVLDALQANHIEAVVGTDGVAAQANEWFLQNDDHTSAAGQRRLAGLLADQLIRLQWIPRQ